MYYITVKNVDFEDIAGNYITKDFRPADVKDYIDMTSGGRTFNTDYEDEYSVNVYEIIDDNISASDLRVYADQMEPCDFIAEFCYNDLVY